MSSATAQEKLSSRASSIRKEHSSDEDLPRPSSARNGKLWRRALGAEDGNETQRAMQSRHLMMIGMYERLAGLSHGIPADRRVTLLKAIGGTIGTGIFLSAGSVSHSHFRMVTIVKFQRCDLQAVALAGPASALLSYFVVGIFVYSVVIALYVLADSSLYRISTDNLFFTSGEMSSMYPVSGAFSVFGTRFVSPALGFTLGTSISGVYVALSD